MTENSPPVAENSKPKLRSCQYSLRRLFLVTLMVAVVCSWFATKMYRASKQAEAVRAIRSLGGTVWYGAKGPPALAESPEPAWLRKLVGVDFLVHVYQVTWQDVRVTDAELQHLAGLPDLSLLYLDNTLVTDAGLERVGGLTRLGLLSLENTPITDAGLEHLRGLSGLIELHLEGTKVTDSGVRRLKQVLPHCRIER